MELITYGIIVDRARFEPIKNGLYSFFLNKPMGGLWTTPTTAKFGWKEWCIAADYHVERLNTWTRLELKRDDTLYIIDSLDKLVDTIDKYPFIESSWTGGLGKFIDFEKIVGAGYDGIYLTEEGLKDCDFYVPIAGGYYGLNTWDCETVLLFNLDIMKGIIEKKREGN
jgi:hypothetical protein